MNSELTLLQSPLPKDVQKLLDTPFGVVPDDQQFYARYGFVRVSLIIPPFALKYIRDVIDAAVFMRTRLDTRKLEEKSLYQQSFLQCGYLCFEYPAVKSIVFSKRLAGIARDLMGVQSVRLWHDQALYKEAGGRETDVHIDSSYWPVSDPIKTTTIWIALDSVPEESGCLQFYPESQQLDPEYVDIFKKPYLPESLDGRNRIVAPLRPGDATFHTGLTWHGAGKNQTDKTRKGMTIIYVENGLTYNAEDARNSDHTSCDGLHHGDVIDTQYTPVLI